MSKVATTRTQPPVQSVSADRLYRKARRTSVATEDETLNALCDSRLKEPRYPLDRLLKKLGHGVEK
jgi:hypothetical protein